MKTNIQVWCKYYETIRVLVDHYKELEAIQSAIATEYWFLIQIERRKSVKWSNWMIKHKYLNQQQHPRCISTEPNSNRQRKPSRNGYDSLERTAMTFPNKNIEEKKRRQSYLFLRLFRNRLSSSHRLHNQNCHSLETHRI